MKRITASEFKAKCLAILDEVQATGEVVIILKHGKAVGQLSPAVETEERFPQQSLKHSVAILGEVIEPALPPEEWEAIGGRRE